MTHTCTPQRLAPDLAEGHLALARYFDIGTLDFARAQQEYERAVALAPGNALGLSLYGRFVASMGGADAGVAAARRAVVLDPLNPSTHGQLSFTLSSARRYGEAVAASQDALAIDPDYQPAYGYRGIAYYVLGDLQSARTGCEIKPDYWGSQLCLAVVYERLGRHADAEAMLAKIRAANGDDAAYQYGQIYAQWGDALKALGWLETALRMRDPGLGGMKTDPLLDPLRKEPRSQAIERQLKFPYN